MSKLIKNIDTHEIEMPFSGSEGKFTYRFPVGVLLTIPDDLFDFMQETLPLSFAFRQDKKEGAVEAPKHPNKSFLPNQALDQDQGFVSSDMRIRDPHAKVTFGEAENLPPSGTTDKDGIGWYGEGLEVTGGSN